MKPLILLALFPALLWAEQRAQVTGAIRDTSNAILISANVTAVNTDSGIRRTAQSDAEGAYAIASLPAGLYKITVRKEGFQTVARLNVTLSAGQNTRIDVTMQVGSMRQVITIDDAPTLINAQDGSVGLLLEQEQIERLPLNGRGVLSLLDLAPGVLATPATSGEAGQFSTNGQRPNMNYFTVDGVSANTSVSGGGLPAQFAGGGLPAMTAFGSTHNLATNDDLQEVKIQTSSFAPEFGRLPGAHIGISTRGGSNEFHGSAFYQIRNHALNANDWFANRYGLGRQELRLNDWGAALGGPLQHDRTFFFASYEGLRLVQPFSEVSAVPSEAVRAGVNPTVRQLLDAFPHPNAGEAVFAANYSRPAQLDTGSLRIDRALSARHSAFLRYNQAPSSTTYGGTQLNQSQFGSRSTTAALTSLLAGGWNNDLRVNYSLASVTSHYTPSGLGGAVPLDFRKVFPTVPPQNVNVLYGFGIANIGEVLAGDSGLNRQSQWNILETLAVQRGNHAVRMGVDFNRLSPARDGATFSLAGRFFSVADLLAGKAMDAAESQSDRASSRITTASLFMQDTWRIRPRLALTYGVRWELTPAPSGSLPSSRSSTGSFPSFSDPIPFLPSTPPAGKIWPMRYSQFAPRLGAAYRISQRSVLRAGWGVFYDLSFSVATDPINGIPFNRWQFVAAAPILPVPIAPTTRSYTYAPNLQLPRSIEWNVAYEYALTHSDIVSASYVGSSGTHLLRREGALQNGSAQVEQIVATNHGESNYNALELQYRRRLSHGVEGLLSYSWSHSLDNGSYDSGLYLIQNGVGGDRASSSFDVRHSFNAALSVALFRNWSLDGIARVRSGFPIDVLTSPNLFGLGFDNVTRPDLVSGSPVWLDGGLNPAAFAIPAGVQGNLGRNTLRGFGHSQLDIAVRREFRVWNESVMQLRVEAFNALNTAAFADPVPFLSNPFFGQSTSMLNAMLGAGSPHSGLTPSLQVGGPRTLQISLKFRF